MCGFMSAVLLFCPLPTAHMSADKEAVKTAENDYETHFASKKPATIKKAAAAKQLALNPQFWERYVW